MYFTIGGRKTKSGLYRVTYTGEGAMNAAEPPAAAAMDRRRPRDRRGSSWRSSTRRSGSRPWSGVEGTRQRRPLHPVRRPRRRSSTRTRNCGPRRRSPRRTRRRRSWRCSPWRVSAHRARSTRKDKKVHGDPALRAKIARSRSARIDFAKLTDEQKLDLVRDLPGPVQPIRASRPPMKPQAVAREVRPGLPGRQPVRERRTAARCSSTSSAERSRRRR